MQSIRNLTSTHRMIWVMLCVMCAGFTFTFDTPASAAEPVSESSAKTAALPVDAKPGQCYAKVLVPHEYNTETKPVLIQEESERIKIIPAQYQSAQVKIAIEPEVTQLVPVAATYKKVAEKIEIEPSRLVWRSGRSANAKVADARVVAAAQVLGLPIAPQLGDCYAEFFTPAEYKTETQQILIREASERIEISEPKYEWVEQQVVVKEASEALEEQPAVYDTVTERILQSPAYSTWKKGGGLNERVDHATGEIMCRVEVPAVYKTIEKRVLKRPASIKRVAIPAQYKMVRTRKLVEATKQIPVAIPAQYKEVSRSMLVADAQLQWRPIRDGHSDTAAPTLCYSKIPAKYALITKEIIHKPAGVQQRTIAAKYQTIAVKKLSSAARENRETIPERYAEVTKRVLVKQQQLEWRPVLCDTNTTPELIKRIQRLLQKVGLDPGTIDGKLGQQTLNAIDLFQEQKGIARGGLTLATLRALGIELSY